MDKDFLRETRYIKDFLDIDKTINAEIRSSFTLRKSITLHELLKLVNEIRGILSQPLSEEKERLFKFLDSAELVKDETLKERLKNELFHLIYDRVVAGEAGEEDFDFCHPKEALKFLSAKEYSFGVNHRTRGVYTDNAPTYIQVIDDLKNCEELAGLDYEVFEEIFDRINFRTKVEDENGHERPLGGKLWKHIHGEISMGDTSFFLIDGEWYRAPEPFLENLQVTFQEQFDNNAEVLEHTFDFLEYPPREQEEARDNREGRFNLLQAEVDGFYFGDKIFARYGNGKIELFDLLRIDATSGTIHIIQTKDGFGASMRDACSQIGMAAQAIEDDLKNGCQMLREYHSKWYSASSSNNLNMDDFISLFRDYLRIYAIACAHTRAFSRENLSNGTFFQSHIAKFEIVGIIQEFRAHSRSFRLLRIAKD